MMNVMSPPPSALAAAYGGLRPDDGCHNGFVLRRSIAAMFFAVWQLYGVRRGIEVS